MPNLDEDYAHAVVPALPGFWLYLVNRTEDPPVWKPRASIVAWVVQYEKAAQPTPFIPNSLLTYSTPVTSAGTPADSEYVIEQPDGSFVRHDGEMESSLVDLIDYLQNHSTG